MDSAPAAEAAVLFALTACPSLLIAFGDNPFEAHKAAFLWVFALAGFAALASDVPRLRRLTADRPWTRWLAAAAIVSAAALVISVTRSQSPALAWWGSGLRRYGAFTELALLAVMTVTAVLVTDRTRLDRVLAAVVLGSIGPTVYALSQWLGFDPLAAHAAAWPRPGSTFGNPLFFSGYLVATVPLTIAYAERRPSLIQKAGVWGLVIGQGLALAATRSRGPLMALAVAATIVGAAVLLCWGHRRSAAVMAIATVLTAAAVVVLAPGWMRAGTATVTPLVEMSERNQGTIAVRTLLWQAAGSGIRSDPRALAFGSGPESMTRVLTRYAGASLRLLEVLEGQDAAPDRAHNETLDTVVAVGIVGLAARVVLLCTALGAAFAGLGLLSRANAVRFAVLAIVVTLVTAGAAWLLHGAWTLALSVPGALVMVAAIWIARSALAPGAFTERGSRFNAATDSVWVVPAAATTCWLAHYFEIQTGFANIGSALAGTIGVALTVACARRTAASPPSPGVTPTANAVRIDDALAVVAGWATAVLLIALTGAAPRVAASTWIVTAITWCIGTLVLGTRVRTLAVSAAVWLTIACLWLAAPGVAAGPGAAAQAASLAGRISVFATLSAASFVLVTWRLTPLPLRRRVLLLESVGILIAAAVAGPPAIRRSETDVLIGSAGVCERKGDVDCAVALYTEVGRRDETDERAFTRSARVLADAALSPAGALRRDELFRQAADQLAHAWSADPFDYHHARNRGSVERMWAKSLPPSGRAPHLEEADRWYAAAVALAPSAPVLRVEWANLKLEQHRPDDALPLLEQSLALGGYDVSVMCDALLGAIGIDIERPGGLAQAAAALRARGSPRLAEQYAKRATATSPPR